MKRHHILTATAIAILAGCATYEGVAGITDRAQLQNYDDETVCRWMDEAYRIYVNTPKQKYRAAGDVMRDEMRARHPEWRWDLIDRDKIAINMSREELICSWGMPQRINSASHGPDQWVYGRKHVYVHGGRVTAWN